MLLRKDILVISAIFWLGGFFLYLAYHLWGVSLINDIYHERSVSFLNEIIEGRDSHPLEFYYTRADDAISRLILSSCLLPIAYASFMLLRNNDTSRLIAPVFLIDLILPIVYLLSFALPHGFLRDFVNLNLEQNLPTWYSSVKLFFIGMLFLILAHKFRINKSNGVWVIFVLALTFLTLSLDEFTSIHEYLGVVSDKLLPGGDRRNTMFSRTGIWMFLIGVPFLIFMLYMIFVLRRYVHNPKIIKKYIVGLIVFLGSAGGIEILYNFTHGENEIFQAWAEECGEMLGVSIILWATYDLLAYYSVHIFATGGITELDPHDWTVTGRG